MMTYAKSALPSRIVHWTGCLLGTALAFLYFAFVFGQGLPPLSFGSIAITVMVAGFLLAWWKGSLGGLLGLVGISGFYLWNFSRAGHFPGGWMFPLCFVAAGLLIIAAMLRPRTT